MEGGHKPFASAAEVARLAGVSRSAVSRTFTDGGSVSPETRRKVIEAAKALNYHVNHLARGISQVHSRPVCLVGSNLSAPFQSALLAALTQRIHQFGRATMVINTSGESESVGEALNQALQYRASAIVVMSGSPAESLVQTSIESGQQVILINRKGSEQAGDGPSHITIDYRTAMGEAAAMFARAGCKSVAVIGSTAGTPSLRAREVEFSTHAERAGIAVRVVKPGPTAYETGQVAARMVLGGTQRPEGVFCVTDLIACGFIDTARTQFNVRFPDDLCLLGFDDIEQAGWDGYALTTFHQPMHEIAEAVCVILKAERTQPPSTTYLDALPVWRSTMRLGPLQNVNLRGQAPAS